MTREQLITAFIGVEDLAFHIATYLVTNRTSISTQEITTLCYVSRTWNQAFTLVRAQLRHDHLIRQLSDDEQMFHKLLYITSGSEVGRPVPPEGCLRIFRSSVNRACKEAMREYRFNRNNDDHSARDRVDSRPDYYYHSHRETAECIEIVPPRELSWMNGAVLLNEIEWDDKARLINQFWAQIDDVNGIENVGATELSKEGRLNLGYHELVSVRDGITARLNPRPPPKLNEQDSTEFLRACNAKTLDTPRRIRFAHVVGEDHCRSFVHRHLLPLMGARPTGNTWRVNVPSRLDRRYAPIPEHVLKSHESNFRQHCDARAYR